MRLTSKTGFKKETDKHRYIVCLNIDMICMRCQGEIGESSHFRVNDAIYHEACLRCAACSKLLNKSCFLKNNLPYCREDFLKYDFLSILWIFKLFLRPLRFDGSQKTANFDLIMGLKTITYGFNLLQLWTILFHSQYDVR